MERGNAPTSDGLVVGTWDAEWAAFERMTPRVREELRNAIGRYSALWIVQNYKTEDEMLEAIFLGDANLVSQSPAWLAAHGLSHLAPPA